MTNFAADQGDRKRQQEASAQPNCLKVSYFRPALGGSLRAKFELYPDNPILPLDLF